MRSSSGLSSISSGMFQNPGCEGDLQKLIDRRRRKRMISNRESARRSRLMKRKHLDDLTALASIIESENCQLRASFDATVLSYISVETENAILRAQAAELGRRLEFLIRIVSSFPDVNGGLLAEEVTAHEMAEPAGLVWNSVNCFSEPIVTSAASADGYFQRPQSENVI